MVSPLATLQAATLVYRFLGFILTTILTGCSKADLENKLQEDLNRQ